VKHGQLKLTLNINDGTSETSPLNNIDSMSAAFGAVTLCVLAVMAVFRTNALISEL